MTVIGEKRTFAFETAPCDEYPSEPYLTVDIYVADKLLTIRDNVAYVPQFLGDVDATCNRMRHNLSWLQYRDDLADMNLTDAHLHLSNTEGWLKFLNWGPTTDDISCHLIVYQDSLWITAFLYSENPDYETNTPIVHGVRLSPFDLIATLESQSELKGKSGATHIIDSLA
ncbi:hypothetical protein [Crateriforma spongiae]|uniref:hypothetical protein n=1 Tax=Crateriforma spongiae TaxID=2724528 RepID=UPI0039B104C0